jgi:two-component system, OmpR family, copper resistance phosphate regulon response regulator CusR
MKVLIVDDDPKLRAYLTQGLTESGMQAESAPNGEMAVSRLGQEPFDVVLLDVMLPGMHGWDVLKSLRSRPNPPAVIFVTARDALEERLRGLRAGGDDYLVKPFAFEELLARIEAVLRRRGAVTQYVIGDLVVDLLAGTASRAGKTIALTPTEFSLLKELARQPGKVCSRADLLNAVWGIQFDPGTNVVDVHIRRLRAKLDDPFPTHLLQTVRGAGYALKSS